MEGLKERIEEHVRQAAGAPTEVRSLSRMGGGACQELYAVELCLGGRELALVLRSDAKGSLPGSLGRRQEFHVVRAAAEAGVPTPQAHWLGEGLAREGAWAYFLDRVDGQAIGAKVLRDPTLEAARERLPAELARALAAVHRVTPRTDLPLAPPSDDPAGAAIAFQRSFLARLPVPRPALDLALRWLDDHRPRSREVTLVHGDFRVGNFMVGPEGLSAVLDWEFAHWGSPFEDVAWLCVRDWRFGQVDRPAGGLCGRGTFYRLYAEASGRGVDPSEVHFWEVVGNVRWGAGAVMQGLRYLRGGEPDLELVAIARRAAEMEYEALRLIEAGPPEV